MTKTSIKKILQRECGGAGLINRQQVRRALGGAMRGHRNC